MINFDLSQELREQILSLSKHQLDPFYAQPSKTQQKPHLNPLAIKAIAKQFSFEKANDPEEVVNAVIQNLKDYTVHTTHSGYLGLFNPRANYLSILADLITAYINPQLAAWSHAAYANEIERLVIQEFGNKFGYQQDEIDGTFCTGGAESNLTAILCALQYYFPAYPEEGILALPKRPIIYCSSESHHSILKAAKTVGLGKASVKSIPVEGNNGINLQLLKQVIQADRKQGNQPFMVIGTAGTTGTGIIDNLSGIASLCKTFKLWFHVDAAYGGAIIVTKHKDLLKGIEQSDSITLDLHKWFSIPMGASLFLTSKTSILQKTFQVSTAYMPADGDQVATIDPYIHSIQWSRRFIGLKIYLPLAVFGWKGYAEIIAHQFNMGIVLKNLLHENGWVIINSSPLPVLCFSHPVLLKKAQSFTTELVERVNSTGETWLSTYPINNHLTIRACITNYNTKKVDLEKIVHLLNVQILQKAPFS